jgi:hypothetical protein
MPPPPRFTWSPSPAAQGRNQRSGPSPTLLLPRLRGGRPPKAVEGGAPHPRLHSARRRIHMAGTILVPRLSPFRELREIGANHVE